MINDIKIIGFDADDTLWINEPFFIEAEDIFSNLLLAFDTHGQIKAELLKNVIISKIKIAVTGFSTKPCWSQLVQLKI